MSGMQMTGMNEGRGRGSTVGRSGTNDGAGATKTCPRCGAVLFSDMNRCYGCLYDFPEQDHKVGLMTPDEPWEDVDEPWGSLDGLWAEGEAAVGGASPSADKRDAAFEEFTGMPDVMPGAEGESRAGVSEPSGVQSPSGATPGASFVRRVSSRHGPPTGATSLLLWHPRSPLLRCFRRPSSQLLRHPLPLLLRLLRTLWFRRFPAQFRNPLRLSAGYLA